MERGELLADIARAIEEELTPHQREVLVALALNEVPIDVLAERLGTTRGALYKTLHDARRKLRRKVDLEEGAARAAKVEGGSRSPTRPGQETHLVGRLLGRRRRAELGCEGALWSSSTVFVELESAGRGADEAIPGMRAHLEGCPACREDYEEPQGRWSTPRRKSALRVDAKHFVGPTKVSATSAANEPRKANA